MPKRTQANQSRIVEAYKRLGSKDAVAKELGLHWQTVAKHLNQFNGICPSCWKPLDDLSKKNCSDCRKKIAERRAKSRADKLSRGTCKSCGEPLDPASSVHCAKHKAMAKIGHDRWKSNHPDLVIKYHRQRSHRNEDGTVNSLVVRERDGNKCVVCGVPEGNDGRLGKLEIHHIDGTHRNSLDNMDTVCFKCHRAITYTLKVSNRELLFDYLRKRYP